MSDEIKDNSELTLGDIAQRTRRPEWRQADRIMTMHPKCLKEVKEGDLTYKVSPALFIPDGAGLTSHV